MSYLVRFQLRLLSLPLALLLYIGGWKRGTLRENGRRCGLDAGFSRFRFCLHVSLDFMRLLQGRYGQPIRIRPQDQTKLKKLKSSSSLFLTAHFHHWECMGSWMSRNGVSLLCAARPLAWPPAEVLLARLRRHLGVATLSSGIPRQALRHLDRGGCFALLWDQRVSRSSVQAPFFDVPLRVDPLPDFLLRHRKVPVWFGALLPDGTFRLLLLSSPATARLPLASHRLARRYHRVLELLIRRHPTWWYGMAHRRFLEAPRAGFNTSVSRETSVASGVMVSRETKLSS